jgi:hypothetical protein
MTIFYCPNSLDSPNLEGPFPVFISPRNRAAFIVLNFIVLNGNVSGNGTLEFVLRIQTQYLDGDSVQLNLRCTARTCVTCRASGCCLHV